MSIQDGTYGVPMKPNKKVCKRCWEKSHDIGLQQYGWEASDDVAWKEGRICCPSEDGWMLIMDTREDDLEDCPYRLEHLVSQ